MEIITDEKDRCIRPLGRLDANSSMDLHLALTALPDDGRDVILDMSECHYMSSAGIRVLLTAKKRLLSCGNELYLAGVIPEVYHVLEVAGLHRVLHFETNVEAALAIIRSGRDNKTDSWNISAGNHRLTYRSSEEGNIPGQLCLESEIVSYHELGYAIGFGSLENSSAVDTECTELFVALEHCSGFLPLDQNTDPDFRITSDPVRTGLTVCEALSFGHRPSGYLKMTIPGKITLHQLNEAIRVLKEDAIPKESVTLMVVAGHGTNGASLTVALTQDDALRGIVNEYNMVRFRDQMIKNSGNKEFTGITFHLAGLDLSAPEQSLQDIVRQQLTFENITAVASLKSGMILEDPVIWLFRAGTFIDGRTKRLTIEIKSGVDFGPQRSFLTRLLYTDSSTLLIDPLHGGYSAQTFRVTSFDHEGRKMRPTVLKIAHRKLITRESERCKQYALPYIFNNSAVVLGAEYYGETGALRYNFVGIGGESSQLKWLTHYYQQADVAFLEPLFDKIFLQILKPWYGQPVRKTIYLFRDHDPTFTFFPYIYNTVSELFSIPADEQYIPIPESDRPVLNPYWFLKHEFARRREQGMEYFTGICHGDLNMQNILLDENMNVYLIDFSETKPRSIISDFARLEAIFLVDNAPLDNEADMNDYLHFIREFYKTKHLGEVPEILYTGKHKEKVLKNAALTLKMRKYAFDSVKGNPDPVPYYIALLEWVLPVVCYTLPLPQRRLSMIVSSALCEMLMEALPG